MEVEEMYALAGAVYRDNFKGGYVDREDMLQEGVIGILRAEKNYDASKGSFRTLAYSYALWSMMDYFNRESAETKARVSLSRCDELLGYDIDVNEYYGVGEICMGAFKDRKKRRMVELYLDSKSYREIGDDVGVSRQRVSKVISELKVAIKDKVADYDEEGIKR